MNDNKLMNRAADNIRILAASMVEKANSGHPGGAMGGADFVNVLFSEFLVYDPENGEALLRDIPNVTSCAASKTLPDRSARDTHLQSVQPSQPSS